MKIGIIGSSGFLGLNLAHHLTANSAFKVTATSRKKLAPNHQGIPADWIQLDLNHPSSVQSLLSSIDVLVYLAHEGLPTQEGDWNHEAINNLSPFLGLLDQIKLQKRASLLKVIYLSSGGAIYGASSSQRPWKESDEALPTTTYGILKLTAEHYLRHAVEQGYCTGVCLRVSNPYANRFAHIKEQGIIDVAASKIKSGQSLRLFGGKNFVRDFIHIHDLNRAIESSFHLKSDFEVLNLGSGVGSTLKEALSEVENALHQKLTIDVVPPAAGARAIPWSVLDISKAKRMLNWTPEVTLQEGIKDLASRR